jgi:hypothetical protein
LKGETNNLPAPFTPEKLIPFISEKKTDPSHVPADSYSIEFLQVNHLAHT